MVPNLANVRRFLLDYFSDEELIELAFDHFHEVYRRFTANQSKGNKALMLIEYCQDRQRLPDLLDVIESERSEAFRQAFGQPDALQEGRVNLNTAEVNELMNLPGLGPRLAQAIIYNRPFQSIDELRHVNGFGPRRFAALYKWVIV